MSDFDKAFQILDAEDVQLVPDEPVREAESAPTFEPNRPSRFDSVFEDNDFTESLTPANVPLRASMSGAIKEDPDRAAQDVALSKKTGIPADIVSRNREEIETQSKFDGLKLDDLANEYPGSSAFLTEPINAAQFHDDTDTFAGIEKWVRDKASYLSGRYERGNINVELGRLRTREAMNTIGVPFGTPLTDAEKQRIQDLNLLQQALNHKDEQNQFFKALGAAAEQIPNYVAMGGAAANRLSEGLVAGGAAGATTALVAGQLGPQIATPEEIVTVPAGIVTGGLLGMRTMMPVARASAVKEMFTLETGSAYNEFLTYTDGEGNTVDPQVAAYAAVTYGTVASMLENFALSKMGKVFSGSKTVVQKMLKQRIKTILKDKTLTQNLMKIGKDYAVMVATESITEGLQQFAQKTFGELTKMVDTESFKEQDLSRMLDNLFSMETLEEVGQSMVEGARASAVIGGVGATSTVILDGVAAETKTVGEQRKIDELGDLARNSKGIKRNPEGVKEFVDQIATEDDKVHIPGKELYQYLQQNQIDPTQDPAFQGVADQIEEAATLDADVVVPLSEFVAHMAPSDHFDPLRQHMRLSSDSMTPFERETAAEQQRQYVTQLMAEAQKNADDYTEAQTIYETVREQLVQTGRVNDQVAKLSAQIIPAWATVMAQRTGKSIQQVFDEAGLTIQGPHAEKIAELAARREALSDTPAALEQRVYHGAHQTAATAIIESGGLKPWGIEGVVKVSAGDMTEEGLIWLTPEKDIADYFARGGEAIGRRENIQPGATFQLDIPDNLKMIDRNEPLTQEQRDILNPMLPDYKQLYEGDSLRSFEWRNNGKYGLKDALVALGMDGVTMNNGKQIAIMSDFIPATEQQRFYQSANPVSTPQNRRLEALRNVKVSEMTLDELRTALLTNDLTGIPNRRAYIEETDFGRNPKPVQVSIDADSLKWVNDNMTHAVGDQFLKEIANIMAEVGGDQFYHVSGDEFVAQGDSFESMFDTLLEIEERLGEVVLEYTTPTGEVLTLQGLDISYGIAETLQEADRLLAEEKQRRETEGLRAGRGEPPTRLARAVAPGRDTQGQRFFQEGLIPRKGLNVFMRDFDQIFRENLDLDSSHQEVMDNISLFNPKQQKFLKLLAENDWFGFDYPAQAINFIFTKGLIDFEITPELRQFVGELRGEIVDYQSPITLQVLQDPMLQGKEGKLVNVQTINQILNQKTTKQIEKDIINEVLKQDGFKGQKKIPFDDFKLAVERELMPLEQLKTGKWADYGSDNLGFEYDQAESVVYNSTIEHGIGDHFESLFSDLPVGEKIQYEIVPTRREGLFIALDKNRPQGLPPEALEPYVGSAGSMEQVQKWIEEYEKADPRKAKAAVFGHVRRWDTGTDRFIPEIQSDFFQKQNPAETIIQLIIDDALGLTPEQEKLAIRIGENDDVIKNASSLVVTFYEQAASIVRSINQLTKEIQELEKEELEREKQIEKIRNTDGNFVVTSSTAPGGWKLVEDAEPITLENGAGYEFFVHRKIDDKNKWVVSEKSTGLAIDAVGFGTREEAIFNTENKLGEVGETRLREAVDKGTKVPDDVKTVIIEAMESDENPELETKKNHLAELKKSLAGIPDAAGREDYEAYFNAKKDIEKAKRELEKTFTIEQKQFIAHRKNYVDRMVKEEIRQAVRDGKTALYFPTPHTLATIEGYIEPSGGRRGNTLYEEPPGNDGADLVAGDEIEYDGYDYTVAFADSYNIEVVRSRNLRTFSMSQFIDEEIDNAINETESEIGEYISLDSIDQDNWYGQISGQRLYAHVQEYVQENDLSSEDEINIVNFDIEDIVRDELSDRDWEEELREIYYNGGIWVDGDTVYAADNGADVQTLPQPDQVENDGNDGPDKEDFEITDLNSDHQTVARKYEELNQWLQEYRPDDVSTFTDDNNYDWIKVDLHPEDASLPVTLFQEEDQPLGFFDVENTIIGLTTASNVSTFLHESAHFFLEMEKKFNPDGMGPINEWFLSSAGEILTRAQGSNANLTVEQVSQWIVDGTTGDRDLDSTVSRAAHEQFARAFETYLMEGKAPSIELRDAFRAFARWLTDLYRKIKGDLGVTLTPEIRQIFDRMLATEDQIAAAEAANRYQPLFTDAAMAGMTEEEFAEYQKRSKKPTDKANETLREKILKELTRQTEQWWKEEKRDRAEAAVEELRKRRVYAAIDILKERNGQLKLDRASVKELLGIQSMNEVPALKGMTLTGMQGVTPDEAAILLDYESGDQLLLDIMDARPIKEVAEEQAQAEMMAEYGDIFNDGTIEREAQEAAHNEERGKVILEELKALGRGQNQPVIDRAMIKQLAMENIGRLPLNKIIPSKYRRAEIKAAQAAQKAMDAGDRASALAYKTQQALNFYLWRAATEAHNRADIIVRYTRRFSKKNVRTELLKAGNEYLSQIDSILERFQFKGSMKAAREARSNIEQWAQERAREGDNIQLTQEVLDELYRMHYKEVPFDKLLGVYDSLRNLNHVARFANKIRKDEQEIEFQEIKQQWLAHLDGLPTKFEAKRVDVKEQTKVAEQLRWAMSQMTKMPFLTSWLDGGERVGLSHDLIMAPINQALSRELELWKQVGNPLMEAITNRSKEDRKRHGKKIYIPEIQDYLYGDQILSVALNSGNLSNLEKMLKGEGWVEADAPAEEISIDNPKLQAVLTHMTKSDWELVDLIWRQIDELFPLMAEVHKRTSGITLDKVEATPVETRFGTYRGGYYPMKYDHLRSKKAADNKEKADEITTSMFAAGGFLMPNANTGAKIERTKFYGPVRFSLDVVPNHLQEVIHYITHYEAVRQIYKLTNDTEIAEKIESKVGRNEYGNIKKWLNDVAKDGREAPPKTFFEKMIHRFRLGTTLGVMGFKASTGLIQISGLSNTFAEVGVKHSSRALRHVLSSFEVDGRGFTKVGNVAWNEAANKSSVLENRAKTADREVRNALHELEGKRGIKTAVQEASMKHIMMIQVYMVDLPSWYAGYYKGIEEAGTKFDAENFDSFEQYQEAIEKYAVKRADWTVENVQGSGLMKDLPLIMRNQSEGVRLFTMFMTFFSSLWNMQRDLVRGGASKQYSPTTLAAKAMFLFAIPVAIEMTLRGDWGDEDDEERVAWEKYLTNLALYPANSIPFVRDVSNAVITNYKYQMSPVSGIISGVADLPAIAAAPFTDEELTKSNVKNASKVIGAWFGIPGVSQVWNTGEHLYQAMEEGEELTTREFLFGPKK